MSEEEIALTKDESGLFEIINQTLPESQLLRWRELIELRDAERLTDDQQTELVELGEQIELLNANRFRAIHELAKLRDSDFSDLCHQLQITPN